MTLRSCPSMNARKRRSALLTEPHKFIQKAVGSLMPIHRIKRNVSTNSTERLLSAKNYQRIRFSPQSLMPGGTRLQGW